MSPADVALADKFARILARRSRAEFDDLRQVIYLKFFLARKNYRPELGPWPPYAWRQALQGLRDVTQNWRKERPTFVEFEEHHHGHTVPDPGAVIDASRALDTLPTDEHRAVVMWAIEEHTDEEGAVIEGKSTITFRRRRRRGVAALRELAT